MAEISTRSGKSEAVDRKAELKEVEKLRGKDGRLLLGVTGGIASGKTTVARMLEESGVRTIDFDVLSRIVVEPGKPAYNEIVGYFGAEILLEDGNLDRKKLSEIVFRDSAKRKKLESFIHPRLGAEFIRFVEEYAAQGPGVIIQAVIPLLIEGNMQATFHKILLVYIPKDEQVKRLMKRDKISKKMAEKMLGSQMSIEEKKDYADFVIDNSGPLEETRRQVEGIVEELKAIQGEGKA